jgi:hypothetical protein
MSNAPCQISKIITTFTLIPETAKRLKLCGYSITWADTTS